MVVVKTGDIWAEPGFKVIPTNLMGVMGRGLAKQAKDKVRGLEAEYKRTLADNQSRLRPNSGVHVWEKDGDNLILLPVKTHWSDKAEVFLIRTNLWTLLVWAADRFKIDPDLKIAVPLLGCGFGELNPEDMLPLIKLYLSHESVKGVFTIVQPEPALVLRYPQAFKPGSRADKLVDLVTDG